MESGIVVIGTSSGGMDALRVVLRGLPRDFPLPVVVVQHRAADAESQLCAYMQKHCTMPVGEPDDKEPIRSGQIYVAPADYHLLIDREGFTLSTESRVCNARPSIDVLFESASDIHADRAVGVILTGGGWDGARGLARIKQNGGTVIVQEPSTAHNRAMPDAAIAAAEIDNILPLSEIAPFLSSIVAHADG